MRASRKSAHFVIQHKAEGINAMHANVSQWTSRRQFGIVYPRASAGQHRNQEVGARHLRMSLAPAAMRSQINFALSSKRIVATPRVTPALRAASTIVRASAAFIAIGFSHSTGLRCCTAVSTSAQCSASGLATNTASTSGQAQRSLSIRKRVRSGIDAPTLAPAANRDAIRQPHGSVRRTGIPASLASQRETESDDAESNHGLSMPGEFSGRERCCRWVR